MADISKTTKYLPISEIINGQKSDSKKEGKLKDRMFNGGFGMSHDQLPNCINHRSNCPHPNSQSVSYDGRGKGVVLAHAASYSGGGHGMAFAHASSFSTGGHGTAMASTHPYLHNGGHRKQHPYSFTSTGGNTGNVRKYQSHAENSEGGQGHSMIHQNPNSVGGNEQGKILSLPPWNNGHTTSYSSPHTGGGTGTSMSYGKAASFSTGRHSMAMTNTDKEHVTTYPTPLPSYEEGIKDGRTNLNSPPSNKGHDNVQATNYQSDGQGTVYLYPPPRKTQGGNGNTQISSHEHLSTDHSSGRRVDYITNTHESTNNHYHKEKDIGNTEESTEKDMTYSKPTPSDGQGTVYLYPPHRKTQGGNENTQISSHDHSSAAHSSGGNVGFVKNTHESEGQGTVYLYPPPEKTAEGKEQGNTYPKPPPSDGQGTVYLYPPHRKTQGGNGNTQISSHDHSSTAHSSGGNVGFVTNTHENTNNHHRKQGTHPCLHNCGNGGMGPISNIFGHSMSSSHTVSSSFLSGGRAISSAHAMSASFGRVSAAHAVAGQFGGGAIANAVNIGK